MFRGWMERRLYRKTMQVAVGALRRAARTPNVLEKLHALELAEQKLKEAQWLSEESEQERFAPGLAEVQRSRQETLEQAQGVVARLLEAAADQPTAKNETLAAAGMILSLLNHYLPESPEVEALNGRLISLEGRVPSYTPVPPLSERYHRAPAGAGCVLSLMVIATVVLVLWRG